MSQEMCANESCHRSKSGSTDIRAADGTRICPECFHEAKLSIARLPELYRDCEELLTNPRTFGAEGVRVRGGLPSGVCLNDAVVAARSEILTVAASWARRLAEEQRVPTRPRRTIDDLCRFLLIHLRRLAAQSSIADALAEFRHVIRRAEQAIDPGHGVALPLGPCEKTGCDGMVYATMGARSTPTKVSCDHGHLWPPSQWLLLRHRLEQARRVRGGRAVSDGEVAA